MTDKKKYIDIDDFGNMENVIKKVDPAFSDVFARMPGPVANWGQQSMSMAIKKKNDDVPMAQRPHILYLLAKEHHANKH